MSIDRKNIFIDILCKRVYANEIFIHRICRDSLRKEEPKLDFKQKNYFFLLLLLKRQY